MNQKDLQQEITKLEAQISTMQDNLDSMKETLQNLKDIAWDRQSKKESSSMYKVLKGEKSSTNIQSNVGTVKVDKDFMEKEKKHLDSPDLRGMITKDELLSFPKVARNIKPEYNNRTKDYTWRAKANDNSVLRYGSRKYDGQNRILTAYSETKYGARQDRGEQGQLRQEFNDRDFLRPTNETISQNPNISQINSKESQITEMRERVKNTLNSNKTQINKDKSLDIDR